MIDYIFRFADEATALAAAAMTGHMTGGGWLLDHVLPNLTVTRISTGLPIAGWFCMVSVNRRIPFLEGVSALQIACDRDACNAGQRFVLINNVGAIITDVSISPVFAGSLYPIGGYN